VREGGEPLNCRIEEGRRKGRWREVEGRTDSETEQKESSVLSKQITSTCKGTHVKYSIPCVTCIRSVCDVVSQPF
jgi:hypothetical protein